MLTFSAYSLNMDLRWADRPISTLISSLVSSSIKTTQTTLVSEGPTFLGVLYSFDMLMTTPFTFVLMPAGDQSLVDWRE